MSLLKIGKAAEYTGLHPQTLRNYVSRGLLTDIRSPSNQRLFDEGELDGLITRGKEPEKDIRKAYYARSSENDKNHLNNQIKNLVTHYGEADVIIKDGGSGLNENRKGLQRLILLAQKGEINRIYITQKDRLTRFGYSYLETLFEEYGVSITVLGEKELDPHEELLQDFMSLLASFSGKYYQLRSNENKLKLLEKAKNEVSHGKGW